MSGITDKIIVITGAGPISRLDALRVDDWEAMIDINIKGLLYGIAAALPIFQARGSGQFVNVASTAAHRIVPTMAVYAATKTAVRTLASMDDIAMAPDAVARAIAFAIEQPDDVDVGEIIVRPTAQS